MAREVRTKVGKHKQVGKTRVRPNKESSKYFGLSLPRAILVGFSLLTVCGCLVVTIQLGALQRADERRDGIDEYPVPSFQARAALDPAFQAKEKEEAKAKAEAKAKEEAKAKVDGCCQISENDDTCAQYEYENGCVQHPSRQIGCSRGFWSSNKYYDPASGRCLPIATGLPHDSAAIPPAPTARKMEDKMETSSSRSPPPENVRPAQSDHVANRPAEQPAPLVQKVAQADDTKCTLNHGYANNKIDGGDESGIGSAKECQALCSAAPTCTCWSWKEDGFCRTGKPRLDSCSYTGSADDDSWLWGECSGKSRSPVKATRPPGAGVKPLLSKGSNRPKLPSGIPFNLPHQTQDIVSPGFAAAAAAAAAGFAGAAAVAKPDPAGCARDVHVFYYMWYGSVDVDGSWVHWNHQYLENWQKGGPDNYPKGRHDPDDDDIGSTFWPQLGPYSSRDSSVIRTHMKQMKQASIGVAVLSWYPAKLKDDNGKFDHDELLQKLLEEAAQEGIEVAIHVEPYKGRTAETLKQDIEYIHRQYGKHPALHKRVPTGRHLQWLSPQRKEVALPVFYLYDSYNQPAWQWSQVLTPHATYSIRDTDFDAIVLCLWTERNHATYLSEGGFDGAYSYFASNGFTYGSTAANWQEMKRQAESFGTFFSPSVGPGYNDEQVRPWNSRNSKGRDNGKYYETMFKRATNIDPAIISITSWNEWHEGTNIEPAEAHKRQGDLPEYDDYGDLGPEYYLQSTHRYVVDWATEHKPSVGKGGSSTAQAAMSSTKEDEFSQSAQTESDYRPNIDPQEIPVLIITSKRPQYLRRALDSVIESRGDRTENFPITCSQDSNNAEVSKIIDDAVEKGDVANHLIMTHKPEVASKSGYYKLCQHYRWALGQMFDENTYERLIILEEDLEVSSDFFDYFAATLPLLEADKDLFCVSAWNDNGKPELAADEKALFRTDFFPGLGWMLLKGFWEEVKDRWPPAYWDDFVRRPDVRKDRHCIRPEVSRSHTFGEVGVSKGQFYKNHLFVNKLNEGFVDWTTMDLRYLSSAAVFDKKFEQEVRAAKLVTLEDINTQIRGPEKSFAIIYADSDRSWKRYAKEFGLMEDEKAGIRRGAYRGVLPFTWKGKRVFLVKRWPLRP